MMAVSEISESHDVDHQLAKNFWSSEQYGEDLLENVEDMINFSGRL